jgi:polyhydroxyalkanoate synthesis repressor PhaR
MPILIKRYANRKLYNTQSSRYITLKGIAELLEQGEEVRVVDNETGEDITSVALSQILVDSERSKSEPSSTLLTQILERGGDALYDVFKKSFGEATDGIGEFQDRLRRIILSQEEGSRDPRGGGSRAGSATEGASSRAASDERDRDGEADRDASDRGVFGNWIAYASPDFDASIQNAIERVFKVLDLPRRKDVEDLNENLQRLARAVETLERTTLDLRAQQAAARTETAEEAAAFESE